MVQYTRVQYICSRSYIYLVVFIYSSGVCIIITSVAYYPVTFRYIEGKLYTSSGDYICTWIFINFQ